MNNGFADRCLTAWLCRHENKKWPEAELNRRHTDFQSVALPTELSGQNNGDDETRTRDLLRDRQAF